MNSLSGIYLLGKEFFYRAFINLCIVANDLSIVGKGLENFGISTMIYPSLEPQFYINVTIMVVVAAILSSIYPAIKALQLKPAEAVRAI